MDQFESEKSVLQQRIDVIETLQRNRTGGQDLLQMVANTVVRVDHALADVARPQRAIRSICRAKRLRSTPWPISSRS